MIKTIFFDFDGVLVESTDIKTEAFGELFSQEGAEVVRQVIGYHRQNAGISRYVKIRYFYQELLHRPLSENMLQDLCVRFEKLVLEKVVFAPYVKGAIEFLESQSANYHCFVVSATPQREMEEIIGRRGLTAHFRDIFGSPTKKNFAVQKVLADMRMGARSAVYVGDALTDFNAASENRVPFIARISSNESVFDAIECRKIPDLTSLHEILKYWNC